MRKVIVFFILFCVYLGVGNTSLDVNACSDLEKNELAFSSSSSSYNIHVQDHKNACIDKVFPLCCCFTSASLALVCYYLGLISPR